ncbi:MAG: pseudaminic acid cytidylyltransferase, partial [Alphaproteobacteria bacterium]|nr:pseudaminic acid cytidylyltransferase [Alphaproteobacteria bacterium]
MASPARIAVIPARGGSRRLLRKNVADFLGRPILAWTVAAA